MTDKRIAEPAVPRDPQTWGKPILAPSCQYLEMVLAYQRYFLEVFRLPRELVVVSRSDKRSLA